MIKYAAVPVLAILAACSAEVENGEAGEANVVETLSVNNLVITGGNTATAEAPPPAQPPQIAAPVADSRAARTAPAEPKQQAVRKPSTRVAEEPASSPPAPPAADPEPQPEAPAGTCTAEHRAMGHC